MKDLTLSQKHLICIVNNKGKISGYAAEKRVCMIAAALLDLKLAGCVRIEQKTVAAIQPLPETCSHLKPLYDFIADKSPIKIIKLMDAYNMSLTDKKFSELFNSIGDSLAGFNLVTVSSGGLFAKSKRYLPSAEIINQIIDGVRTEFLGKSKLSENTAALMVLLDHSKMLKEYFSDSQQKQMKDRLQTVMESVNGQLVCQMVRHIEQIVSVIAISAGVKK